MMINSLAENEYFVFGSNLAGIHGAGAARQARKQFGAEIGIGEGITGKCYAFPTLDENFQRVTPILLTYSRDRLFDTCKLNPDKQFLLTKVGCGLAGFDESFMRGLFTNVERPDNLILPKDWQ